MNWHARVLFWVYAGLCLACFFSGVVVECGLWLVGAMHQEPLGKLVMWEFALAWALYLGFWSARTVTRLRREWRRQGEPQ